MESRRLLAVAAVALIVAGCKAKDAGGQTLPCDVFQDVSCIDASRIKADVDYLASPALAGRRAGRTGNVLAAQLIEGRFRTSGLAEPVGTTTSGYRQLFPIDDWTPSAEPSLSVGGSALALGSEFDLVEFSGSGSASGELVFVGYGTQVPPFSSGDFPSCTYPASTGFDELAGLDLAGNVAVMVRGYPNNRYPGYDCPLPQDCLGFGCYSLAQRIEAARAAGAVGVVLVAPLWRAAEPNPFLQIVGGASVPVVQIDRDVLAATAMPDVVTRMEAIDGGTPSGLATAVSGSLSASGAAVTKNIFNVIGIVPGTDPTLKDEVVVIGAHFDHMGKLAYRPTYYPGADDNASGAAVMLELARAVAASATKPARTLVFAAWNAEEWGLWGSAHYVVDDPIFPVERTVAAFSIDMVGLGDPGLMLSEPADPQSGVLVDVGASSASELGLSWPLTMGPAIGASDHLYFWESGVPAAIAMTPTFELHTTYHTPDDVPADVTAAELESAAKLAWAAVRPWALGTETAYQAPALRAAPSPAMAGPRPAPGFVRE